ncbi:zinc ribbon domain-containing protein [Sulfurovum mangrovi]|jgi:hypothetical protein|uniref:zinc ribbon domain-containing protein n=1 Tax=Sulfurovum mangrovi TaxID=2893889 RepID=UPI001E4AD028|nr:zinc ribbon domain-containing protein [Sulfurovum mangrovi]UFH60296.1 zinc ribbon domain-containing protein [Sulfurovum mangrovi]
MQNFESKQTKTADEKYCSECGQIINIKAEICPKCGVRQVPISEVIKNSTNENKKFGEKFLFSGGILLIIFLLLIFATQPRSEWMNGVIGSFAFALFGGVIAMAIPTTRKIIYIPVITSLMIFIAFLIGISTSN